MALIILGICDSITIRMCGIITYLIWRKEMVEEYRGIGQGVIRGYIGIYLVMGFR